jgi:hypothetical protein
MFQVAAQNRYLIGMPLQRFVDKSFSHGDLATGRKTPIADVGDGAASGLRHKGFKANDFFLDPFGFALGVQVVMSAICVQSFVAAANECTRQEFTWLTPIKGSQKFDER